MVDVAQAVDKRNFLARLDETSTWWRLILITANKGTTTRYYDE